jgi:hypothetical protein
LLQRSLAPQGVTVSITVPDGAKDAIPVSTHTSPLILQNEVVTALNKIAWNTYATSVNTAWGAQNSHTFSGVYAGGGWIRGGTPGIDSVPIMAMQDEFMVNSRATRALTDRFGSGVMDMINTGRVPATIESNFAGPPSAPVTNVVNFPRGGGGNNNAELVAEVKALRKELEQMRKENNSGNVAIANVIPRSIASQTEELGEKIESGGKRVEYGLRQASRDQKVRG